LEEGLKVGLKVGTLEEVSEEGLEVGPLEEVSEEGLEVGPLEGEGFVPVVSNPRGSLQRAGTPRGSGCLQRLKYGLS